MNVGFVHGVMNTDNMAVSGESIDFGPCAFMEGYDPATVFSSIDHGGRYAYANQGPVARWNLARLAESRDKGTGKHIERVQIYCRLLATCLREHPARQEKVNEAFIENIFRASPLHDIGKVAIRDSILLKPGPLTPSEFDEMKSHTTLGAQTLEEVQKAYPKNGFVRMGIEIARSHHERWDGTGYPHGLAGTAIPLSARIMAVADSYDAARSRRFYKPALPHAECCAAIYRRSGTYVFGIMPR